MCGAAQLRRRLMNLAASTTRVQRHAGAVGDQMDVGAQSAGLSATGVVVGFVVAIPAFFARANCGAMGATIVPSIAYWSASIRPRASSVICSAAMLRSQVPSRRHQT